MPKELLLLRYSDRFGAEAVFGRTPGAGELKGMILSEMVMNAYQERAASEDWAKWAEENPYLNWLLTVAVVND